MSKLNINVIEKVEDMSVFGLWMNSNDKYVSKDIQTLSKKYYEIVGKKEGGVLTFFVLSKDYNEKTKDFELFVGGFLEDGNLEKTKLPAGYYGMVTIKPMLGFLWGLSIGQAKRYFYTQWLPKSNYRSLNLEFEYHTEKSVQKSPEIELYFAVTPKG